MEYHINQRLSLKDQACTIRYIGPVATKPGSWLGVEWDDTSRGKHDGTFAGNKYFDCKFFRSKDQQNVTYNSGRSSSPTAASFLRPNQAWDTSRSFLQALKEKYMPEEAGTGAEIVYFSGKQAEEVGFEKFAKRQKQLQGIHVVVLDHMRIRLENLNEEREEIAKICSHITDLDLGSNLFENFDEVVELVGLLPKLRNLVLDGNRLKDVSSSGPVLEGIKSLGLSNTLLTWPEISQLTQSVPNLQTLVLTTNELHEIRSEPLPKTIQTLDLAGNNFTTLSALSNLAAYPSLKTLVLKQNQITSISPKNPTNPVVYSTTISTLDLSTNKISTWTLINHLPTLYPSLTNLRISTNPLYTNLLSASTNKPLTAEDGYILTIARLPALKTLNFSPITEKERLNAETYYLSQIAAEVSRAGSPEQAQEIVKGHPRWDALCEEYGEPAIAAGKVEGVHERDPNSLGAKLITLHFHFKDGEGMKTWKQEIPATFKIYTILGIVGKELGVSPLCIRLFWQTGEKDPVFSPGPDRHGIEEWDSSDEEDDGVRSGEEEMMVDREVELQPGTRALGTYISSSSAATIRVEIK